MFYLIVCLFLCHETVSQSFNTSFYRGPGICCDVDSRLAKRCTQIVPGTSSKILCAKACAENDACIAMSVDSENICFLHRQCWNNYTCTSESKNLHSFSKNCDNGGYWIPSKKTCRCRYGWVGSTCQEHPRSCKQLALSGYYPKGNHNTLLDIEYKGKRQLIPASCYVLKSGYNHLNILTNPGHIDYNRSWDEYRNGFVNGTIGSPEVWIGLETWHILSQYGYTTLKLVTHIEGLGQILRYYYGFIVSDQAHGYSFTYATSKYGTFLGPYVFGDCFDDYQNVSFSTFDNDVDDVVGENCAAKRGSGWWFKKCSNVCNLLGWGTSSWGGRKPVQRMRIQGFDINKEKGRNVWIQAFAIFIE